jgi:GNAT superfamily N-acetyltransferase
MPGSLPVLPMSIDEFHVMDDRLGWKHEFWDGAARLSCQATAVATLKLELPTHNHSSRQLDEAYRFINVTTADELELIQLFHHSFYDAIEYAGWDESSYERDAERSIKTFFGRQANSDRANGLVEHSFAVWRGRAIVAAILIRDKKSGPTMEPVMVDPAHQRLGLGSSLLAASVRSLVDAGAGVLHSRCHLGNTVSLNWHQWNGFRELPDYFSAAHRAMHFQWQAEHFGSRNQPEQAAEMLHQAEHWRKIAEEQQAFLMQRRQY